MGESSSRRNSSGGPLWEVAPGWRVTRAGMQLCVAGTHHCERFMVLGPKQPFPGGEHFALELHRLRKFAHVVVGQRKVPGRRERRYVLLSGDLSPRGEHLFLEAGSIVVLT